MFLLALLLPSPAAALPPSLAACLFQLGVSSPESPAACVRFGAPVLRSWGWGRTWGSSECVAQACKGAWLWSRHWDKGRDL